MTMFNPAAAIAIVADSVAQVRRTDVFRLLDTFEGAERTALARYLRQNRPDLSAEIEDCLDELFCDEIAGGYAGGDSPDDTFGL
jgi:hypothetical protein